MATDGLLRIEHVPRKTFLNEIWDARPDEHVTVVGPTGSGKTHLMQQLLRRSATPENPAVVLVLKPEDATVERWIKRAKFRRVQTWPVPRSPWRPNPPAGYVVWPRHSFNVEQDDAQHFRVFQRTLMNCYSKGRHILFADEVAGLERLELKPELETIWERGRAMDCALWVCSQRPTYISSHAYTQASHLFFGKVLEQRYVDRCAEIVGHDKKLIRATIENLRRWEWLYVRAEDRTICTIGR